MSDDVIERAKAVLAATGESEHQPLARATLLALLDVLEMTLAYRDTADADDVDILDHQQNVSDALDAALAALRAEVGDG